MTERFEKKKTKKKTERIGRYKTNEIKNSRFGHLILAKA